MTITPKFNQPYAADGQRLCPECSSIALPPEFPRTSPWESRPSDVIVLLVQRTNRTTGEKFMGCPNWPRCSCTFGPPASRNLVDEGLCDHWSTGQRIRRRDGCNV